LFPIEDIAWHKAGIMKADSIAFMNPHQPETALDVVKTRSREIGCQLYAAPDLEDYSWGIFPKEELGLFKAVHGCNASLALQLSR
jgi:folylpolyglutamate synthase/dihydropteroate synthase